MADLQNSSRRELEDALSRGGKRAAPGLTPWPVDIIRAELAYREWKAKQKEEWRKLPKGQIGWREWIARAEDARGGRWARS